MVAWVGARAPIRQREGNAKADPGRRTVQHRISAVVQHRIAAVVAARFYLWPGSYPIFLFLVAGGSLSESSQRRAAPTPRKGRLFPAMVVLPLTSYLH